MKYKVLAFDIDGTLTNSRKEITPETGGCDTQGSRYGLHDCNRYRQAAAGSRQIR